MSLKMNALLPALDGATHWSNGEPMLTAGTSAILVHFWSMSCPACKGNMRGIQDLQVSYRASGVYVVAVHSPRTEMDANTDAIALAIRELGITEPCAVDNDDVIGVRFAISGLYPYYYLFDRERKLRRRAAGGHGFLLVKQALDRLIPSVNAV